MAREHCAGNVGGIATGQCWSGGGGGLALECELEHYGRMCWDVDCS